MQNNHSNKEYVYPMRVYYEDTDAGGVVYHASYVRFMERARSEWLIQEGFVVNSLLANSPIFAVRKLEVEYLKPARLYNLIEVVSKVAQLSRVSIIFEQIIRAANDHQLIFCSAKIQVVSVNDKLKPCGINPQLLERFCYDA